MRFWDGDVGEFDEQLRERSLKLLKPAVSKPITHLGAKFIVLLVERM